MPLPQSNRPRVPFMRQMAIVMELPFTLAGPILLGAIGGALLDRWLGTSPWLLLLLLMLGFVAGLRELTRRMKILDHGSKPGAQTEPTTPSSSAQDHDHSNRQLDN